jgi:predicted Zn-dependent protease
LHPHIVCGFVALPFEADRIVRRDFLRLLIVAFIAIAPLAAQAGPGKKAYDDFAKQGQIYDDPRWQQYVQEIGQRLVGYTSEPKAEFHFTVLDISDVNAFALPDGYIFVNRGLLAYLESEDQIAAVVGHEIGHVVAHHAAKKGLMSGFGNVAGFIGAVLTGVGQVRDTANTATDTLVSGYGREMELQADQLGGEFIAKAGYNPFAMIEVIQVLKDQEMFATSIGGAQKSYHGVFASHPENDKRLHDALQGNAKYLPAEVVEPVGNFWEMIDGLVYGNQAGAGIVKDRTFYHDGLRIVVTFPEGWDVSNSSSRVTGISPAGNIAGNITFQRQEAPKAKQTPKQYVTDTMKRDDIVSGEDIKVGDYNGYIGKVDLAKGNLKASMIAVIFKDGGVYLFKGEAGEGGDAAKFEADFRATVQSFRPMQPGDLKVANNQRIKVIEAKPGDTYAALATKSSIKSHAEEMLRLLNGDHPLGEPRAGNPIKIVQ